MAASLFATIGRNVDASETAGSKLLGMFARSVLQRAWRPAAGVLAAAASTKLVECEKRGITPEVHTELQKLRPNEAAMRAKWIEDEEGWHKLPPRAWPEERLGKNNLTFLRPRERSRKS